MNDKEQQQKYQGSNCETILQPLSKNKVNVYELLDSFVSYVLATKPEKVLQQGLKEEHKQHKDKIVEFLMNMQDRIKVEDLV